MEKEGPSDPKPPTPEDVRVKQEPREGEDMKVGASSVLLHLCDAVCLGLGWPCGRPAAVKMWIVS